MTRPLSSHDPKQPSLTTLIGGVGQSMLPFYRMFPEKAVAVVVSDVQSELDRNQPVINRLTCTEVIPLAEAHTSRTLLGCQYPPDHEIHKATGVASGQQGMGQARQCGRIAAQQAISTEHFRQVGERLQNRLLLTANGVPASTTHNCHASIAGGTGGGAAWDLVPALSRPLQ
jgi:hypothetical protein